MPFRGKAACWALPALRVGGCERTSRRNGEGGCRQYDSSDAMGVGGGG